MEGIRPEAVEKVEEWICMIGETAKKGYLNHFAELVVDKAEKEKTIQERQAPGKLW